MVSKETKPENHLRIGAQTGVGSIVRYVSNLIKENKFTEFEFSAIGIAVGKLVSAVEVLKVTHAGFYQINKISTLSIDTKDREQNVSQRLYPKLEITLTKTEPKEKGEGFQNKLEESEREKLLVLLNNANQRVQGERAERGGRGAPRGESRGGRRGLRGESRGGRFRGESRGGRFRGESRGGEFRGESRGGEFRGESRGGRFRGENRGGRFRGENRGGRFRGENRGARRY